MPDLDLEAVAENLAKTAAALDRLIKAEGQKIGNALGKTYAKAADERIQAKDAELQRAEALVAELRHQMKLLERKADRYNQIVAVVRDASWNGKATIDVEALLDIVNSAAREPS